MAEIDGARLVARCLKQQGVDELFGVVGVPVTGIAAAAPSEGIRYIGTRHEQAAGYAAQAISYLKGRVGACIVVSGPGMTNAISALGNAWANCWPMLLIGGSSNQALNHMGDFQAAPQVELARPFTKGVGQAERIELIPRYIATAVRHAISGRPGPVYLDLPGDIIASRIEESQLEYPPRVEAPTTPQVDSSVVKKALAALRSAHNPLAIIGKGAAWARAEEQVRRFIQETQMPFLASPMGRGVVPDDHPLSVAAARTYALQNADMVFLIGARLNWIMHFGLPPRFRKDVRVVQLDIAAEEIGTNVPTEVPLVGDAKAVMTQLVASLEEDPWEVAVRHKLPITWIVFNNNGIGGGPSTLPEDAPPPPGAFVPNARYDKVIEAFGGKGYHVETPEQFRAALQESFASGATTLINVAINPQSRRRPQQFAWLTRG